MSQIAAALRFVLECVWELRQCNACVCPHVYGTATADYANKIHVSNAVMMLLKSYVARLHLASCGGEYCFISTHQHTPHTAHTQHVAAFFNEKCQCPTCRQLTTVGCPTTCRVSNNL